MYLLYFKIKNLTSQQLLGPGDFNHHFIAPESAFFLPKIVDIFLKAK